MTFPKKPTPDCSECGSATGWSRAKLVRHIHDEAIDVFGIVHIRCKKKTCGKATTPAAASKRYLDKSHEIYRERHSLLDPEAILALRERLKLSRSDLASLLALPIHTVDHWEADADVQSVWMNHLLCIVRDVPEALAHLRYLAGGQAA